MAANTPNLPDPHLSLYYRQGCGRFSFLGHNWRLRPRWDFDAQWLHPICVAPDAYFTGPFSPSFSGGYIYKWRWHRQL